MSSMHGFELERAEEIPEIGGRARLLRHLESGARLLSIENDDDNKVFSIGFRTPPADSTGVAHILEHSVLCGSRTYPLKDPFAELLKSSLQTFLNAMTFPDRTVYPVASQNLADFHNLVDVYLDTVFNPLLREFTFDQEAWHLELASPDGPLARKGVVYNEMKGAYSSPDDLMGEYARQALFPRGPYRFDYGGHPRHIPELTWAALKEFHAKYYHPSNAWIAFYGNDDPEQRLRILAPYLEGHEPRKIASLVGIEPFIGKPLRIVHPYDAADAGNGPARGMVTVNWLLPPIQDARELFALQVLAHALIDTPASPVQRALIDSGLGEDLAGAGMSIGEIRQHYFSTGLKGIRTADVDRIEKLILDTLQQLAEEGIDPATVDAALNTVEFAYRENNTGGYPRGLEILFRSATTWMYEGDPFALLRFEEPFARLRRGLKEGERLLEMLIEHYLLGNEHRATVVLEPDPALGARMQTEERADLDRLLQCLDEDRRRQVADATRRLKEIEATPDPPEILALIPRLTPSDIDPKIKTVPTQPGLHAGARTFAHDLDTRGIVYVDLGFDLHGLPQEDLPYAGLLGRLFLEMGTERESFVSLSQRIGSATGGIYPLAYANPIAKSVSGAAWLILRGKAFQRKADDMLGILRDILLHGRLDDRERLLQIVLEEKARLEADLVPAGHHVVGRRLRAHFHEGAWAAEQLAGLSYLMFIRKAACALGNGSKPFIDDLERVRRSVVNRAAAICNVTTDGAFWDRFEPRLAAFLAELPAREHAPRSWVFEGPGTPVALALPAQVNYVGKALDLYRCGYSLHGSALVIARYLTIGWLWERVRVQGGAYGGFCRFDHLSGVLHFVSYRDPNVLETLNVYDETAAFLNTATLDRDEVERAIIGTIGDLDRYELPDAKGFSALARHLTSVSDEDRQRIRDEVLSTTAEDFRAFAGVLEQMRDQGFVAVMGSAAALEKAAGEGPIPFRMTQVL